MTENGRVVYSEPGEQPGHAASSASVLTAANPVARLFARVINGMLLLFITCCFWLVTLIVIGVLVAGDVVRYLWPLLRELDFSDTSQAGSVIEDALSEYWETYSVGAAASDVAVVVLVPLLAAMLAFVLRVLYMCLMVRFAGGDFGHLALGLRVVNYGDGRRPSFRQALGRALLKQLDWLIFLWLVNGVMVLFSRERRHSYDLAVNTMVVRAGQTKFPAPESHPAAQPADALQITENRAIPLPPSRN